MPLNLISTDRYLIGSKIVSAIIENNSISFRVGGGYL
jgi:hypothetical protein